MLKKINRITRDKDFKKIFKRSKKIDTKNLVFRIAKRDETLKQVQGDKRAGSRIKSGMTKGPRFGFVVSNKINKRATRRNALKRRLRAAVREMLPTIDPNIDVIVLVKKDFEFPYSFQAISDQIKEGLKEITNIKKQNSNK